jgi:cytochrome P450
MPSTPTFDPHDPGFSRNPYPTYARLREESPVLKVQPYNSWWVFRDADVRRVLDSQALFLKSNPLTRSLPPQPFTALANLPPGVFSMDPPRHDRLRALLDPMLAQSIVGMDDFAEQTARQLLDQARGSQRIELYEAFAKPLPPAALFRMLGVADATAVLSGWVDGYIAGHDPTSARGLQMGAMTCTFALQAYFLALAAGGPACSHAGMFKRMQDSVGPDGMQALEVPTTSLNLAIAGYASTTYLLATGTLNLLHNPEQLAALRAEPGLAASAMWEMLRYDAPAQLADRYAAEDTEIAGVKIARGDLVTAVIGSANRDPARWADPDRFDIRRDNSAQLGFGDGIHRCLGAPLVQQVAPAALRTLVQELPGMKLAGTPQWQTDPYLRSVVNLPISIG